MADSEAVPSLPMLGMLVDRTSFDETDDYGIDRGAISDNVPVAVLNVPSTTILKNGRVRRRLRWRPKRRSDGVASDLPDSTDDEDSLPPQGLVRSASSNVSVNSHSNMSYSSRASNRSTHSFSSTQTMQRDNTKHSNTKARRFPLPRPNYPSTFDGVATIGNESSMVHARIKGNSNNKSTESVASSTLFAAADLDNFGPMEDSNIHPSITNESSSTKKRGFPPLFRRKPPTAPRRPSMDLKRGTETPPLSPDAPRQTFSEPYLLTSSPNPGASNPLLRPLSPKSALSSTSDLSVASTPRSQNTRSAAEDLLYCDSSDDLPTVDQDVLESERRVDLRIPEHRQAMSSTTDPRAEVRESIQSPPLPDSDNLSSTAVVLRKTHSLKWSNSESAMTSLASSCVDFLLSADPEDILPSVAAPEIRFSMSELGKSFSEPSPPSKPSSLPNSKRPPLAKPHTLASPHPPTPRPPLLPKSSSFQETKVFEGKTQHPKSPTSTPISPLPTIESVESQTSSESGSSTNTDESSFLDVEKNLQAIHDMGIEHLKHKEFNEALEVFEEILRGQLTRYGEEHHRVGTALHNIGIVHMKQGDYEEAAHVSYEAVRIRRISLPADHPDIAVSLAQLGVALLECRKFKKAISHFREALRIRRKCYGPKHLKVAKLLNNIGCALYELNELEVAKVAFEEALDIQRSTLREVPTQDLDEPANQILLSIASTLSNIGSIKLYWGQNGDASIDLEEALLIQQSVLGDDHPFAKRTEECLEWMENEAMEKFNADNEENSFTDVSRDSDKKGDLQLCTSTAISINQPHNEIRQMIDIFNQNFWSLNSGIKLTCQGGDPVIQETNTVSTENQDDDEIVL